MNPFERPSLVEEFVIEGLHGYRTVGLSSRYAATILIAQNGSGKTTLLAALDAFLRTQFLRLSQLEFKRITCKLRDNPNQIELTKEDVTSLRKMRENSEFSLRSQELGLSPIALMEFLELDYPALRRKLRALHDNDVFSKILAASGYSTLEAQRRCEELLELVHSQNPKIQSIIDDIRTAVGTTEIVYLPTYRRIELPLDAEEKNDRPHRRRTIQNRLGISKASLFNADINFGLSDISDRLTELNQEILFSSNQGYREISANIINELLDGTFDRFTSATSEQPDQEALSLLFSRLEEGRHASRFGEVRIPQLDRVYAGGATNQSTKKFLDYFLSKLYAVIGATQAIETRVEEFIASCNRYLASDDLSTLRSEAEETSESKRAIPDDKILELDKRRLRVIVKSIAGNRRIPLNSLSSGEKQMISLFARLHLYEGEKIFLIDEPELSLSIEWQRKILLDVVTANTCRQAIAITHSPFVFDNELEPYARSLRLEISHTGNRPLGEVIEDEIDE